MLLWIYRVNEILIIQFSSIRYLLIYQDKNDFPLETATAIKKIEIYENKPHNN